ncbi:MAG: hypothetical protein P4L33_14020 [Capsulimonadaceae bacterium]|nr:hypothetical protein [Capsulimonadaceae bacterium]
MRHLFGVLFLAAMTLASSCIAFAQGTALETVRFASNAFQFPGEWSQDTSTGGYGGPSLRGMRVGSDAMTVIALKNGGVYHVWVQSKDYDRDQGTRLFTLLVDGEPFGKTLGAHGHNGWWWEQAGDATLPPGRHVLGIRVVKSFARCGSILLTQVDGNPNTWPSSKLAAAGVKPVIVAVANPSLTDESSQNVAAPAPTAVLSGKLVRFGFRPQSSAIDAAVRTDAGGEWRTLPLAGAGRLFVISSAKATIDTSQLSPAWPDSEEGTVSFAVAGRTYTAKLARGPFLAGHIETLVPQSVTQVDSGAVEIGYRSKGGQTATARWTLAPNANDAKVSIKFVAPGDGYYSVALLPYAPVPDAAVRYDLLPPIYQSLRRPVDAVMVPNTLTSHPVALLETTLLGQDSPVSLGIQAEPSAIPFEWPGAANGVYGFSLLGPGAEWQPAAFAPILGGVGSHMAAGEARTVAFRVFALPGDWKKALEYSSDRIDQVRDYRKPYGVSLTDAAFNMIDLMKNASASGWNSRLKAFEQIESIDTVSEAYPLGMVETALLTHDEDFYVQRSLPTIEFTLTRRNAHFATHLVGTSYISEPETKITIPSQFCETAYWQGLYELLGRSNEWAADFAARQDQDKPLFGSFKPHWAELMGLYRLNPSPELLARIRSEADDWIVKEVYAPRVGSAQDLGFYNLSHYAYWWTLPDLYELTGDKKYLDAAQECAFGTIAGLWSSPQPPTGTITVNRGGKFPGIGIVWWKGHEQYRLGVPRKDGDTPAHDVPAWLVANQGLGLEGIGTYHMPALVGDNSHIFMSAWAPSLLRLYELTGREIYQTYARNSIISRYANYPGYYINGFTDLPLDPNYPYKGPDVTSLYYHHIPVQLGFTIDFLVEEARIRSHGKIRFPWVKQQGYAWFDNRIYNSTPGSVFGDDTAGLWLDRKLARSTSPAINYLTARGHDRFWLVLMNEDEKTAPANVVLDGAAIGIDSAKPVTVVDDSGGARSIALTDLASVAVPAKGLIALSFAAASSIGSPVMPKLTGGRASAHAGGAWGDVEAFRIRSPFGKDSLYVVLTGHPSAGSTATLSVDGAPPIAPVSDYPYEFTLYPWPMDKDLRFSLTLKTPDGASVKTNALILQGSR